MVEWQKISISPLRSMKSVVYLKSQQRCHIVSCPCQPLLTSAELTYFTSQIKRRSGLAAGFGKHSSGHDSCLTELSWQHDAAVVVIRTNTFTGAAGFAHVVVSFHSYAAELKQLCLC